MTWGDRSHHGGEKFAVGVVAGGQRRQLGLNLSRPTGGAMSSHGARQACRRIEGVDGDCFLPEPPKDRGVGRKTVSPTVGPTGFLLKGLFVDVSLEPSINGRLCFYGQPLNADEEREPGSVQGLDDFQLDRMVRAALVALTDVHMSVFCQVLGGVGLRQYPAGGDIDDVSLFEGRVSEVWRGHTCRGARHQNDGACLYRQETGERVPTPRPAWVSTALSHEDALPRGFTAQRKP